MARGKSRGLSYGAQMSICAASLDKSVSEIAEDRGVSRQAVSGVLKRRADVVERLRAERFDSVRQSAREESVE